ncbi:ribosome small subunit-dependent GTPase A [Cyanobium sp. CH-040]|uniref:ribosome small subunit-dependent GTPase A n=1 Tax=Cyanobium sp. CH-040 TaxID=2823708 RepID=UPI0020CDA4A9|nr:ribosome small subunit-dependent GTPase A [Cyanobium sp. CH-040]MCP9927121.1 ribosome small subunit-dependent GTPase A [Cyanobium sp. CH-040]
MTADPACQPPPRSGLVVALQANYCWVELERPGPGDRGRLLCTRRTRLAKGGQTICVGDRVRLAGIDWAAGRGAVAEVEERECLLPRPAVANVSQVVVVVALAEPEPDPLQLTRFLITAEATGRPVELVLSKADLLPPGEVEAWCVRLRGWGYGAVAVSGHTGQGLEPLRRLLSRPGISVLCGPSGVGKSSLLNRLDPRLALRIGAVSGRLQRGRHTTRHVELFALAPGALVADTPGFNRPELPEDPLALAPLFPELRRRLSQGRCRFADCLHQGEPGCAASDPWERQSLYNQCLDQIQARLERQPPGTGRSQQPGIRRRGDRLEPRIDPRLRQPSRRRTRQRTGLETRRDHGDDDASSP